jgi:8-oxo-dGTP pyrophosphatase MutT (NUDIX family)
MVIFVNNIPVFLIELVDYAKYSKVIDLNKIKVTFGEISDAPLILNATPLNILDYIEFLQAVNTAGVNSVTFEVGKLTDFKKFIKQSPGFVKAAGGIVENADGEILMMKRLGVWDFPKGKADPNEKSVETAIREVEEECNITVFSNHKVATTWHTYFFKGQFAIKRTRWYAMGLISDRSMKPQEEEGIEELKWVTKEVAIEHVVDSYKSIQYVLDKWLIRRNDIKQY